MNPTGLWSLVSPPPLSPNSCTVESQNFRLFCHLLIHWGYRTWLLLDLFLSLCPFSCVSDSWNLLLLVLTFFYISYVSCSFWSYFFLVYIQSVLPPCSPIASNFELWWSFQTAAKTFGFFKVFACRKEIILNQAITTWVAPALAGHAPLPAAPSHSALSALAPNQAIKHVLKFSHVRSSINSPGLLTCLKLAQDETLC